MEIQSKWAEMYKCGAELYPSLMGENYKMPKIDNSMVRNKNIDNLYWIDIDNVRWYGVFYIDFLIFELFFLRNSGNSTNPNYHVLYDGTYLETGGADGVSASNSLFF